MEIYESRITLREWFCEAYPEYTIVWGDIKKKNGYSKFFKDWFTTPEVYGIIHGRYITVLEEKHFEFAKEIALQYEAYFKDRYDEETCVKIKKDYTARYK